VSGTEVRTFKVSWRDETGHGEFTVPLYEGEGVEELHEKVENSPHLPRMSTIDITELLPRALNDPMETVLHIIWRDVEELARQNEQAFDLTEQERDIFLRCFKAGMESWKEVALLSLLAATVGRNESEGDVLEFHKLILDEIDLDDEIGASFDDDNIVWGRPPYTPPGIG